jgi:hypothetical protein
VNKLVFIVIVASVGHVSPCLGLAAVPDEDQVEVMCLFRGPDGQALVNDSVIIYPMGQTFQTDAEGKCRVCYRSPSDPRALRAYMRHRDPDWIASVRLPKMGGTKEIRLEEAKSVQGRIVDPKGKPVVGAQIAALPMSDRHVLSDPNGWYDIAWNPDWAGPRTDLFVFARHATRDLVALTHILPDSKRIDITLESGVTLKGIVEDEFGRPVSGVRISMDFGQGGTPIQPVLTDASGLYRFKALPQRQEYTLHAKHKGYCDARATTGRINNALRIVAAEPVVLERMNKSIAGTVIDVDGRPVPGCDVMLFKLPIRFKERHETKTDAQGRFRLKGIAGSGLQIQASKGKREGQFIDVRAGQEDVEVVIHEWKLRGKPPEEPAFVLGPQVGRLQYRWSHRGWRLLAGKGFQGIDMKAYRPQGVNVPKAKTHSALFGKWLSPAAKGGYRWVMIDRSHSRSQHNRLYIDTDGDGHLDDETALIAHRCSQPAVKGYVTLFAPKQVLLDKEGESRAYHLMFCFYGTGELCAGSAGWYEGDVMVGDTKRRCLWVDKNADGTFTTQLLDHSRSDIFGFGQGDEFIVRSVGRYVELDNKLFETEMSPGEDCMNLRLMPAETTARGRVSLPKAIRRIAVAGKNGSFTAQPANGIVELPVGRYRVYEWLAERKDDKGDSWRLQGHSFGEALDFEVLEQRPTSISLGEPIYSTLEAVMSAEKTHSFMGAKLTGRWGEVIDVFKNQERMSLQLRVNGERDLYDRIFTFEYG